MRDERASRQNPYDEVAFFDQYQKMRATGSGYNEILEHPALCALLPGVTSHEILDLGCGDGSLSRLLIAAGAARVTAIDPSDRMLALARDRTSESRIQYRRAFADDLVLPDRSLDLVVSSLALHYVADLPSLLRRIAGWLRPGGLFAASMEHPAVTAAPNNQSANHFGLAAYAEEGSRSTRWFAHTVIKYHRTVSSIVMGVIDAGLTLEHLGEPAPSPFTVAEHPHLAIHRQRPPLLLIRARKIGTADGPTAIGGGPA